MTKVLLTGGSGFIAAHILEQLLSKGHTVVTTVRSEDKADNIRNAHKQHADRLEVVIVPDISKDGAFDEVVKTPGIEVVMHTASPFHYNFELENVMSAMIDPALRGTQGILNALHRSAPNVKRVIITSSFAAILDDARFSDPEAIFTETSWNPNTIDDIHKSHADAYRVSKTVAEHAAWDFVATQKPSFDLVTVNPPSVFGPVVHNLATLESINTSNKKPTAVARGEWKDGIPDLGPVKLWVDVGDTALCHVKAMELPEAGGQRLFAVGGVYGNDDLVRVVRDNFPELEDRLPPKGTKGGEIDPKVSAFSYNNDATTKLLGIKWTSLEDSVVALVKSLKEHGI